MMTRAVFIYMTVYTGMAFAAVATHAVTAPAPVTPRTIESLPAIVWWFLTGYSIAGWIVANLKTAVIAMNGDGRRSEAWAGIVQTLVASGAAGVGAGLYVMTEARWDDKPVSALYAYFAAAIAAYGGQKIWESVLAAFQAWVQWKASRGTTGGNSP